MKTSALGVQAIAQRVCVACAMRTGLRVRFGAFGRRFPARHAQSLWPKLSVFRSCYAREVVSLDQGSPSTDLYARAGASNPSARHWPGHAIGRSTRRLRP